MLVLGIKPNDYVIIDKSITVKILKSKEGGLSFAIDAPEGILIEKGTYPDNKQQQKSM